MRPLTPAVLDMATGCGLPVADRFAGPLLAAMTEFGLMEWPVPAHFIGQCAVESARFTALRENMNYSAAGLAKTWPHRYAQPGGPPYTPNSLANSLAGRPKEIAINVYGGRLGNAPGPSPDGWDFRGGGVIMVTGADNYRALEPLIPGLMLAPNKITIPEHACRAAAAYFAAACLPFALTDDVERVTKAVQGGRHQLDLRRQLTLRCKSVLAEGQ